MTGRHGTDVGLGIVGNATWRFDRLPPFQPVDHRRRSAWRTASRSRRYRPEALIAVAVCSLGVGLYTDVLLLWLAPDTSAGRLWLVGIASALLSAVVSAWCARHHLLRDPIRLPVLIAAGAVYVVRVRGRWWVRSGRLCAYDGYWLVRWWAPMRPRCNDREPVGRLPCATLARWSERDEQLDRRRRSR